MNVVRTSSGARQRGVAIITVMLMVALATIAVSSMVVRQRLDIQRAGARQAGVQAGKLALAGERFAAQQLHIDRRDGKRENTDSFEDDWDTPTPAFPVAGGSIAGCIVDLQGRFNLNSLVDDDGNVLGDRREQLQRLLRALDIDAGKASAMVDWVDSDSNIIDADGAEDDYYTQQDPPYVAANRRMASVTELKLIKGFNTPDDIEDYETLLLHVSALPKATPINVNTATPAVIMSLADFVVIGLAEELSHWEDEAWEDYPDCGDPPEPGLAGNGENDKDIYLDVKTFTDAINRDRKKEENEPLFENVDLIDVKSDYFEVRVDVELGEIRMPQFSLLQRDADGIVTVLQWARGDNLLQISGE